jgi:hypothetical protein
MRKEKKEEDIDELTKMMKEMKVVLMKCETGTERREIVCYTCGKKGIIQLLVRKIEE